MKNKPANIKAGKTEIESKRKNICCNRPELLCNIIDENK